MCRFSFGSGLCVSTSFTRLHHEAVQSVTSGWKDFTGCRHTPHTRLNLRASARVKAKARQRERERERERDRQTQTEREREREMRGERT